MCEHGTETIVECPEWAAEFRSHPEAGISIDSCIADQLVAAWASGVRTLGSCCGHGDGPSSVVLVDDPAQVGIARRELPGWQLFQWRLTDVTEEAPDAH